MKKQSMRILFTGDSITHAGRRNESNRQLGTGFVNQIAELLLADEVAGEVFNTGVSGNRILDLERRWQADVLALKPDIVTVLIGINDTWRRFDSGELTTTEEFRSTYSRILHTARESAHVGRLILMEPFLVPVSTNQMSWYAEDLAGKIKVVNEVGAAFDADVVPLYSTFAERARQLGPVGVVEDGIHPTAEGHRIIAQSWLAVAGLTGL